MLSAMAGHTLYARLSLVARRRKPHHTYFSWVALVDSPFGWFYTRIR